MCLACVEFNQTEDFYILKSQVMNLVKQNEITINHAAEVLDKINREIEKEMGTCE